ncbi:MAG: aldehyde ferredoxin oxidoreductase family protein [Actinobacteria bacterium]|nr:aldehyde ferredoxin oxidoreductase family protein [Actinomycetota bacterium]
MAFGYAGKLLFVDLTTGAITEETPDGDFYRSCIGGIGMGAKVLLKRMKGGVDPLGPDNMLGFTTGPLTATGVYGGGRFTVVAKSPVTGGWADSNSGGTVGPELKAAGYDAVFFSGVSRDPVCLVIEDEKARLVDGSHLWGKDTYETDDMLQAELGGAAPWKVSCIGPAGEQMSLLAGIVNEKGRIAARSGIGAVMGSKKLKAMVVRGRKGARIPIADSAGLKSIHKEYSDALKNSPFHKGLTAAGTGGGCSFLLSIGDCPSNNWATTGTDSFPTCNKVDSANMDVYKLKSYACHSCSVRCGAIIQVNEGPYATEDEMHRPEYETLAAFGPMCRNDNLEAIIKANEICNRFGIDTIGTGATVAFAIECYENGLVTSADTGGLELNWGNAEAIVELTRQMVHREGFGAVLADGTKKAAERIGRGSEEYAMNVGGRELPYHDPRMAPAQGTHYISDSQPASHMGFQGGSMLEQGAALGADPVLQSDAKELFGEWDKKGDYYARGNAYYQLLSSAGLCNLYAHFYCPPVVELLRPITGWDMDWTEGLATGKRILTMRQLFNVKQGVKPDDFRLPKRFESALIAGPSAGTSVPFEDLKARYFAAMDWDVETGKPSPAALDELGVAALA